MPAVVHTDRTILDLLRQHSEMTVAQLAEKLGVTPTAVRQRLNRLLAKGYIEKRRDPQSSGRGRPSHCYGLTTTGQRKTGSNFADLAMVLWDEIRGIQDAEVRRGLMQRLASRLAEAYRSKVEGRTLGARMESLAAIFRERHLPFAVETTEGGLPILTALACPYPDLAERDRSVCAMERMMVSEILGQRMTLDQCRLNGDRCCTFTVGDSPSRTEIPVE